MQALSTYPDPAAVEEALNLGRGAHVRHGVDVLDSNDNLTSESLEFDTGWVKWSYRAPDRVVGQSDSIAAVRRTASLTIPAGQLVNLNSRRLRLWTEWMLRDGTWQRFHLGVFVVVTPGAINDDGLRVTQTLTLADKSHRWANKTLAEPLHLAINTAIVDWVKNRLSTVFGETKFAIASSSATLSQDRTFETGTSELEVMSRLLESAAMDQLTVTTEGAPSSQLLSDLASKAPEITYGAGRGKVVQAGEVEPLLPTLPNVVRFVARQGPSLGNVEGNGLETRKNRSTGPASIDARGFEVEQRVEVDADPTTLPQIADADCQRYFAGGGVRWSGNVALNPRAGDRDVIGLILPRLSTVGTFAVTEWTYPLRPITSEDAVLMPITAEMRVAL